MEHQEGLNLGAHGGFETTGDFEQFATLHPLRRQYFFKQRPCPRRVRARTLDRDTT
jgi:hypothetical protein